MYLTGQFYNLEERMHQLTTGVSDLNTYKLEGSGYLSSLTAGVKRQLSKEVKKKYEIYNDPQTGNFFY